MSGCSRWNFTGGPPETSNLYCHPGRAGGSPVYARLGDLDNATVRIVRASQGDAIDFAGSPFKKRKPRTRDGICLNSGGLLIREWKGKLERVMVLDKGFAWNGKTFSSLSQVAKAITGTSWNGHRFFGLRSAKDQSPKGRVARSSADEDRRRKVHKSKDLGRAESRDNGRAGSTGIGGGQSEQPVANAKYPGTRLVIYDRVSG